MHEVQLNTGGSRDVHSCIALGEGVMYVLVHVVHPYKDGVTLEEGCRLECRYM